MNNTSMSQMLRKSLADWTDPDVAMYYVAVALGVAPDPGDDWNFWGGKKWMFWSNNPMGNGLSETLEMLAKIGDKAKAADVAYDAVTVAGDVPYEKIIETAKKCKCDLIMMASHGRHGISGLLLGSETAKVLTHSKIPVLVVR